MQVMKELLKRIIDNMLGEIDEADEMRADIRPWNRQSITRAETCEDYIDELKEIYEAMKE